VDTGGTAADFARTAVGKAAVDVERGILLPLFYGIDAFASDLRRSGPHIVIIAIEIGAPDMPAGSRTTFKKRQKEMARVEKQRDKAAKRAQKKEGDRTSEPEVMSLEEAMLLRSS
jgi:hypothetical protein